MSYTLLCLTSFAVCALGALLPFVNTELYLITASALAPRALWVPLVLAGTIGAMLGKVVLYYAGRGVVKLPAGRMQKGVAALRERMEARPTVGKLLYAASASAGVPPYYVMTLVCGAIGMNLGFFLVVGFLGRLLRFALVVLLPQVAKGTLFA